MFKTDSHAKPQKTFSIKEINSLRLKLIKTLKDFPKDQLFVYNFYLKQSNYWNLKIIDGGNNGICCEYGNGCNDVIFGSKSLSCISFTLLWIEIYLVCQHYICPYLLHYSQVK